MNSVWPEKLRRESVTASLFSGRSHHGRRFAAQAHFGGRADVFHGRHPAAGVQAAEGEILDRPELAHVAQFRLQFVAGDALRHLQNAAIADDHPAGERSQLRVGQSLDGHFRADSGGVSHGDRNYRLGHVK